VLGDGRDELLGREELEIALVFSMAEARLVQHGTALAT
jgi:hypothetical protein